MLKLNDEILDVTLEEISIENREDGYEVRMYIEFLNDEGENGYIDLKCGKESEKDIKCFLNKEYKGFNYEGNPNIRLEFFDTDMYYEDEIESLISINIYDMKKKTVFVTIRFDDFFGKVEYIGDMNYIEV